MTADEENSLQFPLKVTLTAMSQRMQALIEYYISHSKGCFFSIASSTDTATVVIVDHDHPGTTARLEAGEWHSGTALIVLGARQVDVHGAIMVRKPLDSAALERAAQKALQQLNQETEEFENPPDTGIKSDTQGLPKLTRRPHHTVIEVTNTPAYFRTNDAALPSPPTLSTMKKIERYQAKIELLCGPPKSLEQLRDPYSAEHRLDPARCLSETIAKIVFTTDTTLRAAQLKLPDSDIFILPTLNKVYSSLSLEYKRNVNQIFQDWGDDELMVFTYDKTDVNNVIDILNNTKRYGFSAHSFCWLSALFSSQGRLPLGFDIDTVCSLRHWPNITRLELIPFCLEIVAAWANQPATLPQIIEQVGCEPRHAVSLFNAARTIGVMNVEDHYGS
ncbi:MAG: hypothetical protein AB8B64_17465 [Granulosicoccus sp.]